MVFQSRLDRLLYESPLHTRPGKIAFGLILAATAGIALHSWVGWLTPLENGLILLYAFTMALIASTLGLLFLRYLLRRDPKTWAFRLSLFFFSATVAPAAAAFFNGHSIYATLTVGFVEESWKIFPLLMLLIFAPRVISGVRAGMVYGALGGYGFNVIETAVYVLRSSYPEMGLLAGTSMQLSRVGWWGVSHHIIWSALVGAGLGYAIQAPKSRWRYKIPLLAYLLAVITHTLQDNLVGILLLMVILFCLLSLMGLEPGLNNSDPAIVLWSKRLSPAANALEMVAINIINLPILIYLLFKSGEWERQVLRKQLSDEPPEIITPEEYAGVQTEKRFRLRRLPDYPKRLGRAIRDAQNRLAFQKQYLDARDRPCQGDPLVEYWRTEIIRLRATAPS